MKKIDLRVPKIFPLSQKILKICPKKMTGHIFFLQFLLVFFSFSFLKLGFSCFMLSFYVKKSEEGREACCNKKITIRPTIFIAAYCLPERELP